MATSQLLVTLFGTGLMAFVGWFFFLAPHQRAASSAAAGGQQVASTVKGGYSPNQIEVKKGGPV